MKYEKFLNSILADIIVLVLCILAILICTSNIIEGHKVSANSILIILPIILVAFKFITIVKKLRDRKLMKL